MYAKEYYEYLKTRSSLSVWYKKIMVYPRIFRKSKGKILDYGCGIGDLMSYKKNIIGVDINEHCVQHCNDLGLEAYTVKDNQLPFFSDKIFSTVILDNVFEHLENPEEQFHEIKRVMKDNGILIIGVPGIKGHTLDKTHVRLYNESLLTEVLETLGYQSKNFFYTPFIKSTYLSKKSKVYVLWGVFDLVEL